MLFSTRQQTLLAFCISTTHHWVCS